MKVKNTIFLGDKEQELINKFAELISDICIEGEGGDKCIESCYFISLCPRRVSVMDNFCELWNKVDIEVQTEE